MFYMHTPVNLFIILAVEFNICKGYSFSLNESCVLVAPIARCLGIKLSTGISHCNLTVIKQVG